jgi:predicted RND superfamily exporter protein
VVDLAVYDEDGVIDADGLAKVDAITRAAAGTPGVAEVVSLTNTTHVRGDDSVVLGPGEAPPLVVAKVIPALPQDAGEAERLRARVFEDPLLRGRLISEDGKTAVVLVRMAPNKAIDRERDRILADLDQRVQAVAGRVPSAGIGVVYSALNRASARDVVLVGTASYLLILVLLAWLLGRVGPVLLTLAIIGATAILTLGAYAGMGHDLNMVTMAMPTLLFVMCIEDAVHMLHEVGQGVETDRREKIIKGMGQVFWPCLFTTFTAAAGFFSLVTARMQVVRDLGWYSGAGILGAFVVTIIALPPALAWSGFEPRPVASAWLERWMIKLGEWSVRRRFEILVAGAVMTLAGAWGMSRIDADTFSIDYFYAKSQVRQDSAFIEEHFGPYVPLEMVIEGDAGLKNAAALGAIARWQDRMHGDPAVGWSHSVADVVRRLNQLLSDGKPASFVVPSDDMGVEQALLVYESDPDAHLEHEVADAWKRVRVTVGVKMMSARDIGRTIDRLTALAAQDPAWPKGVKVVPSGYLPLYVTMMDYVVSSQVNSFGSAFLVITALLALLFRSVRMTLLAVPGNLLPLFVTLGLMGALDIRLDVATVTIAAIVLGLVVNNTIHYLHRFREALHAGATHEEAVTETMKSSGVAMTLTSLVLLLGFSVLGLAELKSVALFGLLTAFAMFAALFADLVLLPAMLVTLRPKL